MQCHSRLQEGLIKTGISLHSHDKKRERFLPDRRFNADKVHLPVTAKQHLS